HLHAGNLNALLMKDRPVIKVGHLNTYVIGSYVDHRFREKQINTIAIVLRHEQATYSCVMCCDGRNVTSNAEYSIHSDHFNFEYGTATITCPINSLCLTLTHVAITASGVLGSVTSFQPVRNRDAPTTFPYEFTICISVMYDFKSVLNLVESMEMFRLLGAQRVVIYKTNCDSETQKVLDYYEKSGFVEIIPWTIKKHIVVSTGWKPDISPGQLHYYGQIPALNDCVYRYMYQTRYLALQDMDELILPFKVKTWTELLPELENMYGTDVGFEFENNQFPFTAKPNVDHEMEAWKHVKGINILNYIDRVPNIRNAFNNYKIIVNPRLVQKATVHGLLESVNGSPTVRVNNAIARMYHFKNFTYPPNTNLIRDDHLWDYANDLIPAVSKVLQDYGFIEA
uniref:Glycosyltransferase family 92 protein n=1 Tax=Sinocyclocheilus grahami TaxID=75366 RepID=A0A672RWJ3_SINGR